MRLYLHSHLVTTRVAAAAAAFAIYTAAIILSNFLIVHYHYTPVGFGLTAPAGVWAAALSFPARDVTQRLGGRPLGLIAILTGGAVAYLTAPHASAIAQQIAVASATTYLLSETCDFAIYTPISRTRFVLAVILSSTLAVIIDSIVFLYLAPLPHTPRDILGLTLGKLYVIAATAPIILYLRRRLPADDLPDDSALLQDG